MIKTVLSSIPALVVALAGVGIAWFWYHGRWTVVFAVVGLSVIGLVIDLTGRWLLPARPIGAMRLMESWNLVPGIVAAVASAFLIVIAVHISSTKGLSTEAKTFVGAATAAFTTFATTSFINLGSSSLTADHVMKIFQKHYKRKDSTNGNEKRVVWLDPESTPERLVYSPSYTTINGWGFSARHKRAKGLAESLKAPGPAAAAASAQTPGKAPAAVPEATPAGK
jgi:hypothetical protein